MIRYVAGTLPSITETNQHVVFDYGTDGKTVPSKPTGKRYKKLTDAQTAADNLNNTRSKT